MGTVGNIGHRRRMDDNNGPPRTIVEHLLEVYVPRQLPLCPLPSHTNRPNNARSKGPFGIIVAVVWVGKENKRRKSEAIDTQKTPQTP